MHRFILLATALLSACSSSSEQASKREATPLMSQTMEQRFAASRKRMGDPKDRSRFDPGVQSSLARNKGSGSKMTTQKYKSSSFYGNKAYTQTPAYQAPAYTSASKTSSMGKQDFAASQQVASVADDAFAAAQSPLTNQAARQASQSFREGSQVFSTRANRDALRSQEKNERPQFIRLEEHERNPAYTEDQVRKMLNR